MPVLVQRQIDWFRDEALSQVGRIVDILEVAFDLEILMKNERESRLNRLRGERVAQTADGQPDRARLADPNTRTRDLQGEFSRGLLGICYLRLNCTHTPHGFLCLSSGTAFPLWWGVEGCH